jgi:hypothetical protein
MSGGIGDFSGDDYRQASRNFPFSVLDLRHSRPQASTAEKHDAEPKMLVYICRHSEKATAARYDRRCNRM